ncbi:GATA zinc finger domain-containing protein 10-like isoform X2 [Cucumis melo var. makuwa]|uniref:GATA zinc finger domain-containing protein 10-like isoform X2 n=1 Tax=Cucumis melo var. makuwa TaxID=1194695 RepID=A0A5A7SR70_CUCMM|nr:GATA zinc finger domain-containing protein 10-like isoform X2 [Cucumis melo var. makuwa]
MAGHEDDRRWPDARRPDEREIKQHRRLHDVADDSQQVFDICNNNERNRAKLHGYGSPIMMMPTFGAKFSDSEIDIGYYELGVGPSFSCMDVGLSTSYMHIGHKRGHGEHNEYLCYKAPIDVSDRQEYQQESKRSQNNIGFRVDDDN